MPFTPRPPSSLTRHVSIVPLLAVVTTYIGTGAFALPPLVVSGSGTFVASAYAGSGALTLPALTVSGTNAPPPATPATRTLVAANEPRVLRIPFEKRTLEAYGTS